MLDLELISTLLFFAAIGLLVIKDRKNVEFSYGIIIRRWKKGIYAIDRIVKNHRKLLIIIGNIGVVVAIITGLFGFLFLLQSSLMYQS